MKWNENEMDIILTPGYKVWSKLRVRIKTEVFLTQPASTLNSRIQFKYWCVNNSTVITEWRWVLSNLSYLQGGCFGVGAYSRLGANRVNTVHAYIDSQREILIEAI